MFKKVSALLLITLYLLAGTTFWESVIEIEKKYYTFSEIRAEIRAETNTTDNLSVGDNDASQLIDERIVQFNTLINLLKERPYEVKERNNPFFNPETSNSVAAKLKTRIKVNQKFGYHLAVTRDQIALSTLMVKARIYHFFTTLADEWTRIDTKTLLKKIQKTQKWLATIELKRYTQAYESVKLQHDPISLKIIENYRNLRMQTDFFGDLLNYLEENPTILEYRSLAAIFQLNEIIRQINQVEMFAKLNTTLRYIHLDMGRLTLFLSIMMLSWILSKFLYYKVYTLLKSQILKHHDEIDELLLSNLNGIRRPVLILVLAFGLELGIEVLRYPSPLPMTFELAFFTLNVLVIAYMSTILIDSLFFDYLIKQQKLQKNAAIRQELINLILSILKIFVYVVAVTVVLVKFGVNIAGILASLGIGGLAVALAAQNTLSNFFGLLKIITDNSFSQGDWIETKDVEGTVVEIGFISTVVRTFDNALITIPNSMFVNTPVKNWSKRKVGRRIKMTIGVTYGSRREDLQKALHEIRQMLLNHPDIATPGTVDLRQIERGSLRQKKLLSLEDKYGIKTTLLVYLDEFGDSSVNILIYAFSKTVAWEAWLKVKEDVMLKIWEILERNNLEFAFPSESIYFDQQNVKESFSSLLPTDKS